MFLDFNVSSITGIDYSKVAVTSKIKLNYSVPFSFITGLA
jgi:hypothetical protein